MTIGFIGTGSMVSAIALGAAAHGVDTSGWILSNRTPAKAEELAKKLNARSGSNLDVAAHADVIVLGVKPQMHSGVIHQITPTLNSRRNVVIVSLAAGRSTATIRSDFEDAGLTWASSLPIIRVMPNVNAHIGQSVTGICADGASDDDIAAVVHLMDSVGMTVTLEEKNFPVFSALAGCSPAWMYEIIESLARAGVKHGLTKDVAVSVVAQAMKGSAALVLDRSSCGIVPAQLVDQVTSPGGTTIAGLLAAQREGLPAALVAAVDAAVERDQALS
ncbi:pyrroline-5-carboxylate reductase [Schaalia sp. ZJ405]|uniref:pyrroline-5-carboxylate reductase n=1 Tax=Schaalia sp. ZJ405 TaxID=2709403 RepID=UPI0013EC093B|nr:pyrroline-5-carboxylate reductase [Schaalia sp. ZJ405]QPK80645.1 pyrroline-5-carboxylate reductase [Schaalia sp. ZJ405]